MADRLTHKRRKCVKSPNIFRDKQEYSSLYTISSRSTSSIQSSEMTSQISKQNTNQVRVYRGQHHKGDSASTYENGKSHCYGGKYPRLPSEISQELQEKVYSNNHKSYYTGKSQFLKSKFDRLTLENNSRTSENKPFMKPHCTMHVSSPQNHYTINRLEESYWAKWKPNRCDEMDTWRNYLDQAACNRRPHCIATRMLPQECANMLAQTNKRRHKSKCCEEKLLKIIRGPTEMQESNSSDLGLSNKKTTEKTCKCCPCLRDDGNSNDEKIKKDAIKQSDAEEEKKMDTTQEEYEKLYNQMYQEYEADLMNKISEYEMQKEAEEMQEMERQLAEQEEKKRIEQENLQKHIDGDNEIVTEFVVHQNQEMPESNSNYAGNANHIMEGKELRPRISKQERRIRISSQDEIKLISREELLNQNQEEGRQFLMNNNNHDVINTDEHVYLNGNGYRHFENVNNFTHNGEWNGIIPEDYISAYPRSETATESIIYPEEISQSVNPEEYRPRAEQRQYYPTDQIHYENRAPAITERLRTGYVPEEIYPENRSQPMYSEEYRSTADQRQYYPSEQIHMQRSPREEVQKSPREEVQKSPREEVQNSLREEVQKSPREELQKSPREEVQQSSIDEVQESPREEVQYSPREEVQYSPREVQKNPRDEVQKNPREEVQKSPLEVQKSPREEVQKRRVEQKENYPKENIEELFMKKAEERPRLSNEGRDRNGVEERKRRNGEERNPRYVEERPWMNAEETGRTNTERTPTNSIERQSISSDHRVQSNNGKQTNSTSSAQSQESRNKPAESTRNSPRDKGRSVSDKQEQEKQSVSFDDRVQSNSGKQTNGTYSTQSQESRNKPAESTQNSPRDKGRSVSDKQEQEKQSVSFDDRVQSNSGKQTNSTYSAQSQESRNKPAESTQNSPRDKGRSVSDKQEQEKQSISFDDRVQSNSGKQTNSTYSAQSQESRNKPAESTQNSPRDKGRSVSDKQEQEKPGMVTSSAVDEWEDYQKMERLLRKIPEKEITPHLSTSVEYSEPEISILKHTDSFIINSRRQKEDRPRKPQPKFIKLTKPAFTPTVKGHTYPLKPALKKERAPSQPTIGFSRPLSPNTPKAKSPSKQFLPSYLLRH